MGRRKNGWRGRWGARVELSRHFVSFKKIKQLLLPPSSPALLPLAGEGSLGNLQKSRIYRSEQLLIKTKVGFLLPEK